MWGKEENAGYQSSGNNKIAKINKIKNTDTYKEEKHNENDFFRYQHFLLLPQCF